MTTIYCITEWDSNMNQTRSELFMSINGVANWLTKQDPIGNQFNVTDRETAGDYDITAENLTKVLAAAKRLRAKLTGSSQAEQHGGIIHHQAGLHNSDLRDALHALDRQRQRLNNKRNYETSNTEEQAERRGSESTRHHRTPGQLVWPCRMGGR